MRFSRRLREAVATSSEPQLLRKGDPPEASDEDDDEVIENVAQLRDALSKHDRERFYGGDSAHTERMARTASRLKKHAERLGAESELPSYMRETEAQPFHAVVREAGVAKRGGGFEATLLVEGAGNQKDANWYSAAALERAVREGKFEGAKCFADHPSKSEERDRPERSVRSLIGHFTESRFVPGNPASVRAVFHPVDGEGFGWVKSLVESAIDSPTDRPLVGLSIDGHGETSGQQQHNGRVFSVVDHITHIGSVDLVTAAGAGGMFHRRLQESLRELETATAGTLELTGEQLSAHVRESVNALTAGLKAQDANRVKHAVQRLHQAAHAVSVPTTSLREAEKALKDAQGQLGDEHRLRLAAEARAEMGDRARLASKLLREVDVPARTREAWAEEMIRCETDDEMRAMLTRRQIEHEQMMVALTESLDLGAHVEGSPARQPSSIPGGYSQGPAQSSLLSSMGIDPEDVDPDR